MKKRVFYSELAYVFGLIVLVFGTAFMTQADFGVSMVVAPAYLLHLKISEFAPFFSFGMAEYTLQALILVLMMIIVRKVKLSYFFSLVTAILYGVMLDGALALTALIPLPTLTARIIMYVIGMPLCSAGVSLLFHTYISPEAYEMFVKEVSSKFKFDIHKIKTVYDCSSCIIGIILSFAFFGLWHFEGINIGTVICALLNGTFINLFSRLFEKKWVFKDRFTLKKYF